MIDCLPNVWMVDGILVTAAERDQVSRFFKNSEVLERPVRHKLRPVARTKFVPSHIKDLNQRAVLGERHVLFFTWYLSLVMSCFFVSRVSCYLSPVLSCFLCHVLYATHFRLFKTNSHT